MTKKYLLIFGFTLFSLGINSQNFEKDALDSNTAIIFNPISGSSSESILNRFSNSLIENGFNLAGQYLSLIHI